MDDLTRLTLLFARTLVSDRCCWTGGALARDRLGRPVSALDEAAMSWCALGAVYRIADGDVEVFQRASDALDASARALYGVGIRAVNDSPSPFAHQAVLGTVDQAIDGPIGSREWPRDLLVGLGLTDEMIDPGQTEGGERVRRDPLRNRMVQPRQRALETDDANGKASKLHTDRGDGRSASSPGKPAVRAIHAKIVSIDWEPDQVLASASPGAGPRAGRTQLEDDRTDAERQRPPAIHSYTD
jgi:hypothetical protein